MGSSIVICAVCTDRLMFHFDSMYVLQETAYCTAITVLSNSSVACRRCLPYLKFVRGTGWERKHWTQLFVMLKLVTKVGSSFTRPQCIPIVMHDVVELAHRATVCDMQITLADVPFVLAGSGCCDLRESFVGSLP